MKQLSGHLLAFNALLARDPDTSQMHIRDLQALGVLSAASAPMSVGEVAAALDLSRPYTSRLTRRLVARGLLTSTDSGSDGRIVMLEPTAQGRALDQKVRAHHDDASNPAGAAAA